MKRVFLYAYDRNNLGDDLFVHTIANRYPDVKFYLWQSAENRTTFSCLENVEILDPNPFWIEILKKIRPSIVSRYKNQKEMACNAVAYIGGSIFIEYENWKQILTWWEYEALNRNFYVLGANFGPYHSEDYRESISGIFKNMKDVCFRDKYSQSLFSDVKTVRCAPDILFSYPIEESVSKEKKVFVSVIDCATKDEGDNKLISFAHSYISTIINILTRFIDEGYHVVLSSFCKTEGDENTVELIRSQIPPAMTAVVNYDGTNSQEVLKQISESSFIIASRFHAAILGFAAEKPVLPVIYSDKTIHVLDDVGFSGELIDIRSSDQFDLSTLLMNPEKQRLADVGKIKKQSELHFLKLDQMLEKD
ncbi:MAG: polysaccharide pyruvyl transferase family protein [Aeriscardovia sp.]|nr:polysaccharide pyruvyl transferase family protein [Aeriscardovia sp.]